MNLKSNERTYAAKERSDTRRGNYESNKIDRIGISAATSPSLGEEEEEKEAKTSERAFPLKKTDTLLFLDREREEKRKFTSKLPVRTWKRLRTREPATSRPKSDVTNVDANRKVNIELPRARNNLSNEIDDEVREKIVEEHASVDRSNIKHNNRFALFNATEPVSSDAKERTTKIEISNATRTMHGQRNRGRNTSTR